MNQQGFESFDHLNKEEPIGVAGDYFENSMQDEVAITDDHLQLIGILTRDEHGRYWSDNNNGAMKIKDLPLSRNFLQMKKKELTEHQLVSTSDYLVQIDNDGSFKRLVTKKQLISFFFNGRNDSLSALLGLASMISIVDARNDMVFDWKKENKLTAAARETLEQFKVDILAAVLTETLSGYPVENKSVEFHGKEYLVFSRQVSGKGKITGAIGLVFDSKEALEIIQKINILQQTIEEVNTIIETSYDGFTITDGEGTVLRVNKSHERITGSKPENMVGFHVAALVKDGELDNPVTLRVLEERKTITIKQKVKNGKQIVVTGTPVFNKQGEIIRVVCNLRDVSEFENLQNKLAQSEKKRNLYKTELEHLRRQQLQAGNIFQGSDSWKSLLKTIDTVADTDIPVLVLGETGVGKEVVAKLIHNRSSRQNAPFIKINCSAIPSHLVESELFGYEEGAFTGANKGGKIGLFEAAGNGTIFLDEIGELSQELQVKMLEVLQDKEIFRVGGRRSFKVDARFVFATNRNLKKMVESGEFREDLFFRLYVFPILIPPLRNRTEDILPLAEHFLAKFNEKYGYRKSIHKRLLLLLQQYAWPGNVRELENYIERLVISSVNDVIEESVATGLGDDLRITCDEQDAWEIGSDTTATPDEEDPIGEAGNSTEGRTLKESLAQAEKRLVEEALSQGGSMAAAALRLGVDRTTILRKISKHKIKYNYSRFEQ